MKQLIVATAAIWLGHSTVASAGVPAWCKGATFDSSYDLDDTTAEGADKVVVTYARATCTPNDETRPRAAEVEKGRQAFSKKLGMSDADWADAVAFANHDGASGEIQLSSKDLATFTPLDQYQAIKEGLATKGGNRFDDAAYLADAFEPNLSEAGRLGYIESCIQVRSVSSVGGDAVGYAVCQGDIDALDPAKLSAQLRTDTAHGGDQRMQMRIRAYEVRAALKEHADHVAKIWKEDAAYKKLWTAAKEGRAEWTTMFGGNKAGIALAQKMESGYFFQSRKLFEGCEQTTATALDAAIAAKVSAKPFKGLQDVRKDPYDGVAKVVGPALAAIPEVEFAAIPYILCQPQRQKADFLAYYLDNQGPGHRGPRSAAYSKIINASVQLDDMNEKVEYTGYGHPYSRSGGSVGSAGGTIKSVKVDGEVIEVQLEKLLVKRMQCISSHSTNRISRITYSGNVEYESVCDKSGLVTYDETWAPFKINKVYAPLLKKGVRFSAVYGANGADVIAIWPTKTADLPTSIFGVAVK